MKISKLATLVMLLSLASCATTGTNREPPLNAYCAPPDPRAACAGWTPIVTHGRDLDALDPRTKAELYAHNLHGVALGCWKPHQ